MLRAFLPLLPCLLSALPAQAIRNPDFERGRAGRAPAGWYLATPGYAAELTGENPKRGDLCVRLESRGRGNAPFGNLLQSVDPGPYRGKVVRLRAAVRVDPAGAGDRAQLWMRVDRESGKAGFFDNMGDRPIRRGEWAYYDILGRVDQDAARIVLGLMLIRHGKAWLDDVSFEIVEGAAAGKAEGPRRLSRRGLDNVVAFARLLGYVRYFHPSSEAVDVDWERFAIRGVRSVEPAASARALARKLEELFRPLAPTVRVAATGTKIALPAELEPKNATRLRLYAWTHHGVGMGGARSIYRSERRQVARRNRAKMPKPSEPLRADLAGGVSCLVPLALYGDSKGTLPHVRLAEAEAEKAREAEKAPKLPLSGDDRATRLAAVALGWNVFQHFYPYFDAVGTDWDRVLQETLVSAAEDEDERGFLDTLRRMVAQLHDGHGNVSHRSDRPFATLPLAWDWIELQLVLTRVDEKAAERHGLSRGDVVLKIDGTLAADALARMERTISGATPQFRRWVALNGLLRGDEDEVELELRTARGKKKVRLRRRRGRPPAEPRPPKVHEVRPGIMYLDVGRIDDEDFRKALPELGKAKGIVFDFRGYPRRLSSHKFFPHLIRDKVTSAQWHVPLVTRPDREGMSFEQSSWSIRPRAPYLRAKRAFITDGRAISYAETCMGIVEHYKLGAIVGGPTAGTNGNVNPFTLPGGYGVSWTGMRVLKHDGSQHHGIGILPTVPVERTIVGVREGRDEFLEKAIEIVSER